MPDYSAFDTIFVKDYALDMLIGIYADEKQKPQRVLITIDAYVETLSNIQDKYENTLCYETLIECIKTCTSKHLNLVETLAENIASACLANHQIKHVRVCVEKPDVFKNAGSVGVQIFRP